MTVRLDSANRIRFSQEFNDPQVLKDYLNAANTVAQLMSNKRDKFSVHYNAAEVLVETICDSCVDEQWRRLCLDHLYLPLLKAERYISCKRDRISLAALKLNINKLVPYFL